MLKVLLFGSESDFTSIVLQGLVAAGVSVGAVAIHRARRSVHRSWELPVVRAGDVGAVASAHGIPLLTLDAMSEERALDEAARLRPDILAIACFPRILGEHWLKLAPHGAFNLHPSRLPAYRGPSPLFWQFRNGEERMGITLHRAVAAVDAGPVLETHEVPIDAGASASEVNAALARRGAALLARTVRQVETGALRESVQDEARATWFGWPDESAFRIPTSWTAERAFRFMRGVAEWGRPFFVETGGETLVAEYALDFEAQGGRQGGVWREGRVATIGFASGTLRVRRSLGLEPGSHG